jgi:hypothetical protein
MNHGKTLFAQLMDFVPWTSVSRIVDRYGGNHNVRSLTSGQMLLAAGERRKNGLRRTIAPEATATSNARRVRSHAARVLRALPW